MKFSKNALLLAGMAALSTITTAARAADGIDTAPIVAALTACGVAAGVVGSAALIVQVSIKTFKLIKTAL